MTSDEKGTVLLPEAQAQAPAEGEAGRTPIEFVRASDKARIFCELRNHGDWGIEVQFLLNGDLYIARRFRIGRLWPRARDLAVAWAEQQRTAMETRPRSSPGTLIEGESI